MNDDQIVRALGPRSIVLIGMMGAGKTSLGRRIAARLGLAFADADAEIEAAAGMTIPDIFATRGEAEFRDGERRVVARLLGRGPSVIATGGGAFMSVITRERIAAQAVSIWLRADFDVLMRRVRKRSNRPLLQTPDPEATLKRLITERYPTYAMADLTVDTHDSSHEAVVEDAVRALAGHLERSPAPQATHDQDPSIAMPPSPQELHSPEPRSQEPTTQDRRSPETRIVTVELGPRSYPIEIGRGVLAAAGSRIARLAPGAACGIVTDATVASLHLAGLQASLDAAGIRHATVAVASGEGSKSFAAFAQVCDALIEARLERRDLVLALGGGVVGDLAGFVAASVRRGMRLVQIPTTLLAQVDSSVGGKTGINSPLGKNLVGAFHQASLVLADTALLDTLPEREFRAGYAEVAKYGLIDNAPFFAWLEGNWPGIAGGGPERTEAIAQSCAAKAAMVARDETETGDRALLNLGHTFAHALERLTGYDGRRLVHGEAVAIGLVCAFRFSAALGLCPPDEAARVERHLRAVGLPVRMSDIPGWDAGSEAVLDAMYQDKKVEGGRLTFILARGIGASFVAKNVEAASVRDFLNSV